MKEYEIVIENMTPCGGATHAIRDFVEAELESPEAYAATHSQYPIIDQTVNDDGDTVITTGNEAGYITKYTFTEI